MRKKTTCRHDSFRKTLNYATNLKPTSEKKEGCIYMGTGINLLGFKVGDEFTDKEFYTIVKDILRR